MEYIDKHTSIICPRRFHAIGVLTEQIKAGDPLKFASINFESGQDRIQGEKPKCKMCGSSYQIDGKVHTSTGWQPSDPKMEPVKKKPREMKATKLKLDPNRKEAKQAEKLEKHRDKKPKKDKDKDKDK